MTSAEHFTHKMSGDPQRNGSGRSEPSDLERLVGILNVFLRYRRSILLVPIVVFVTVVLVSMTRPRTYTSDARMMTQGGSATTSAVSGLAAQLGLAGVTQSTEGSPDYYNELLESRTFRQRLYEGIGTSEGIGAIEVKGTRAGMMRLSAKASDAQLAKRVAEQTLVALDAFDRERRSARIASGREFMEQRTAEAQAEMLEAERRLETFMQQNRGYQGSPVLTLRAERLRREVAFRQEMFGGMVRAHEQARIDQLRDNPTFSVLDAPMLPTVPDPRDSTKRGVIGALLGLLVAIAIAFVRDFIRRQSQPTGAPLAEFALLRREAAATFRNPLRRGRSRRVPGRGSAEPFSETL